MHFHYSTFKVISEISPRILISLEVAEMNSSFTVTHWNRSICSTLFLADDTDGQLVGKILIFMEYSNTSFEYFSLTLYSYTKFF